MKNFNFKAKLNAAFQGIFNQSSILLLLFLIALIVVMLIVVKCLLPIAEISWMPVASFVLFALLVFTLIGGFIVYLCKMDTTESAEIELGDGRKLRLKSPAKNLIPAILDKLKSSNIKPDKLIPPGVDLRANPSQFRELTEQQKELIVSKEATNALVEAIQKTA